MRLTAGKRVDTQKSESAQNQRVQGVGALLFRIGREACPTFWVRKSCQDSYFSGSSFLPVQVYIFGFSFAENYKQQIEIE